MNWIALVAVVVSMTLFYVVGSLITSLYRNKDNDSFYDAFVSLIVGFLAVVVVYALIKTNGNTVLLFVPVIGCLYWIMNRNNISLRVPTIRTNIAPILTILSVSVLAYFYYLFLASKTSINYIPHFDDVFYVFLGEKISNYGIETTNSLYSVDLTGTINATPYHYSELWLNSLLSNVFHLNPMFSFAVVLRSIFLTILVLGMMALARSFTKDKIWLLFAILSVTISPVLIDYSVIEQKQCLAYRSLTMLYSSCYVWSIILYIKDNKNWIFPLVLVPVIHIGTMPVVYTALVLLGLFMIIRERNFRSVLFIILPTLIVAVGILLFYKLFNVPSSSILAQEIVPGDNNMIDYWIQFFSTGEFVQHLYDNFKNYAMYVPYILPLFICAVYMFFRRREKLKRFYNKSINIVVFFIFSTIFGLIYGYFFYPILRFDAAQLHLHVNIPLLNIFTFVSFCVVYKLVEKKHLRLIVSSFIALALVYNASIFYISRRNIAFSPDRDRTQSYITNVCDYFNSNNISYKGGYITEKAPVFSLDVTNGYQFQNFCLGVDFMYMTNLSTYFPDKESIRKAVSDEYGNSKMGLFFLHTYEPSLLKDPFYIYTQLYEKENGETSLDSLRLEFIKAENLQFVVIPKEVRIPLEFGPITDTIFTDDKTGERFVFLKK